MADARLPEEACALVREELGDGWRASALAGDASVRAYYRITAEDERTFILAYYPEEVRPQLTRFLLAYGALNLLGAAPEVLRHSHAAVLQRDAGDRTLLDVLHTDRDEGLQLYRRAVELLVRFQQVPPPGINQPFTSDFFLSELAMTEEYYVRRLMGAGGGEALHRVLKTLTDKVAAHPYVLCHRDYHGQNIHILNDQLYLIDYQDLRMGPDMYDLASLLRDRGVASILGIQGELDLLAYYASLRGAGNELPTDWRQRYFETLLQRSLKILGTFSRQPLERGRLHYLDFIPPTIDSIRRCLEELPELEELERLFPTDFELEAVRTRIRKEQNGSA